jgi:hypothetical protein
MDASNWSVSRIQEEIRSRELQLQELDEAIEFHIANEGRDGGFQGRDLETRVSQLRGEIADLMSYL